MSGSERVPASLALDRLIAEATEHLDVSAPNETSGASARGEERRAASSGATSAHVDWARLESRVMAAIERGAPDLARDVERIESPRPARDLSARLAVLALAAAAAIVVFVGGNDRDVMPVDGRTSRGDGEPAGALRATEGSGEVLVRGIGATPGYVLHAGDSIDANGARAVFERSGKVAWLLEQGSPGGDAAKDASRRGSEAAGARGVTANDEGAAARVRVKSAGEPLVLGLDRGAVEAQVAPVSAGEAFAVDIATDRGLVRVAVHGTHLRVARRGNLVVVDLTEGVVSIGVPPRSGVTYGRIVTAPAHVELDATDLQTLRVDHSPAAVRAPIPLATTEVGGAVPARHDSPSAPPDRAPPAAVVKNEATRPPDAVAAPVVNVDSSLVGLQARAAIASAVRECAAARAARPSDVRVTVKSNLFLRVSQAGVVEIAQFSPPLLPEIQTCAAQHIYTAKLQESGLVTIPIEYSY